MTSQPAVVDLSAFEAALARELKSDVGFIQAIGDDLVSAGGKRLRPTLAMLTGQLIGCDPQLATTVALSVELLHSASLLHDDLIDDAATRRGAQSAFLRYGNVVSVMSGDFMLARVLGLLARSGSEEFIGLMAGAAAALTEGEVLQFQTATLQDWSFAGYRRIIEGKTAELLAAATEGVGILAGIDPERRAGLRRFALAYGRAFQLRDDYLDLLGDAAQLGKPVGGDLREGKATYPVLLLVLEAASEEAQAILMRHGGNDGDIERMIDLVREHGADERTRALIGEEVDAALAELAAFPDSPARAALAALVERERERVS